MADKPRTLSDFARRYLGSQPKKPRYADVRKKKP
jgi:hypothetical protein